ncbi:hypothetical protein CSAL01_04906 [Colletotrichum salicis]|uniref:Uncharacterized protein n=1 Tax=Colletotrichum salicis TaxID=1209931 RepID=A0A135TC60_9PEZI|nr:hypothetical protein CSAL01_04906 [Colletotrichum salicis]
MPSETSTLYFLTLALAVTTSASAIPAKASPLTTVITPTSTISSVVTSYSPIPTEITGWKWVADLSDYIKSRIKEKEGGSDIKEDENASVTVPTITETFSTVTPSTLSSAAIVTPTLTLTHETSAKAVPTEDAMAWNWALPALQLIEARELGDSTTFANRRTGAGTDKVDKSYVIEDKKKEEEPKPRLDEAAKEIIGQVNPPSLRLQTDSPNKVEPSKKKADFTILTKTRLFKTVATPAIKARTPTTAVTMESKPMPTKKAKADFTIQPDTRLYSHQRGEGEHFHPLLH